MCPLLNRCRLGAHVPDIKGFGDAAYAAPHAHTTRKLKSNSSTAYLEPQLAVGVADWTQLWDADGTAEVG